MLNLNPGSDEGVGKLVSLIIALRSHVFLFCTFSPQSGPFLPSIHEPSVWQLKFMFFGLMLGPIALQRGSCAGYMMQP